MVQLHDVRDWREGVSCTPTALCSIDHRTPLEMHEVLKCAAQKFNVDIGNELREDYAVDHWLYVIGLLGLRVVRGETYAEEVFANRPTINKWMANHYGEDIELVFCDDGDKIGHVFAVQEQEVVDTHTKGKKVRFTAVPPDFEKLRVKHTFLVYRDTPPSTE